MDFLNSAFLLGLPLAAVPVIIHLLNRRRRETIQWGAMRFLLEAAAHRRRRWRIDDLLLMAVRCALIALIVLALAQPRLSGGPFGSRGGRDVIVVLDNSGSTAQKTERGDVFHALLEQTERVLDDLSGNDRVRVLLAADPVEWLEAEPREMDGAARRQLMERLKQCRPTAGACNMLRALQVAAEAGSDDHAARQIFVLTDRQVHGWRTDAGAAWARCRQQIESGAHPAAVRVISPPELPPAVSNLQISAMRSNRLVAGVGDRITLSVTVRNTGRSRAEATLLRLLDGGESVASAPVRALGPDESTMVTFDRPMEGPAVRLLETQLDRPDDLPLDNRAALAVEVVREVPILAVQGARYREPLRDSTDLLALALGYGDIVKGRYQSVFRPSRVMDFDLKPELLKRCRCVVLANVTTLAPQVLDALKAYVRQGGGLWIIPGDDTDAAVLNRTFFEDGRGLLPLPLGIAVGQLGDPERFEQIPPPAVNHPATALLADTQRLDIHRAKVYRRYLLNSRDHPRRAWVLLATADGSPLVVERAEGRGRVLQQALPLNATWSSLASCQALVPLIHEWLWYLAEPGMTHWTREPGEPLTATFAAGEADPFAELETPTGRAVRIAGTARGDQRVFQFTRAYWPGVYRLKLKDPGGRSFERSFVIRSDPQESELTRLSEADVNMLQIVGGLRFDDAADGARWPVPPEAIQPQPVWAWLLLVLVGLMAVEVLMAGLSRRRGRQEESEAPVTRGTAADMTPATIARRAHRVKVPTGALVGGSSGDRR
jgi:hypothetical protein